MNRKMLLNLKLALRQAETDLGISNLPEFEREMLYGVLDVIDDEKAFSSDELRKNTYVSRFTHATYHRILAKLVSDGWIGKAQGRVRNEYKLLKTF